MGLGEVTAKKRKVIYDDYTGSFYAESKVESLQRQCDVRAKLTDVMNKAEEAKYKTTCKQVNAEKHLFLSRKEKASHRHSEALQDYKAYMNVLDKLAKERELQFGRHSTDMYGKYPPDSVLRNNIEDLIGMELKEMRPNVRRRREATRLLGKRSELTEVDRSLSTEELFDDLKLRKSRMPSPVKEFHTPTPPETTKPVPRLILPAITVRLGSHGNNSRVVEPSDRKRTDDVRRKSFDENKMLPSVFVTDPRDSQLLR